MRDRHVQRYLNMPLVRDFSAENYVCSIKKVGGNQQVGLNLTTVELELNHNK